MKKLSVFFLSLFLLAGISHAQLRKVPAEVTNAFAGAYPTATNVTWKDKITNFEAQFDLSGSHTEARFTKKGEWIETVRDMTFDGLNAPVKTGFSLSKYKDWPTTEIKELSGKNKEALYRINVSKSDVLKRYLYFNAKGQLVKDGLTI